MSRDHSATCCTRSRNVGSAHCRSSRSRISGHRRRGSRGIAEGPRTTPRPARPSARDRRGRPRGRRPAPSALPARSRRAVSCGRPRERRGSRARPLTHELDDRPERDAVPVGQAPSAEDGRVGFDLGGELFHQPRLPRAGRSEDREEVTGLVRRHPFERLPEQGQLSVAADDRRVESAVVPGDTGRDVLESIRGIGSALSLAGMGSPAPP